jgi:hypothetical protein
MPVAPVGQLFVAIGVSLKYIDWVAQFQLFRQSNDPGPFPLFRPPALLIGWRPIQSKPATRAAALHQLITSAEPDLRHTLMEFSVNPGSRRRIHVPGVPLPLTR